MKKTFLFSAAVLAAASVFAADPGIVKADKTVFIEGPKVPAINRSQAFTRAEGDMESFDFTYASEPNSGYSLKGTTGGVTRVYLGFEMTQDDIKNFAGSSVTGFYVLSPFGNNNASNTIHEARFFCLPSGADAPYTQDFTLVKSPGGDNKVAIETPYVITGEEEYITFGYSFVVPKKDNMYYLITDGIMNAQNTCIYSMADDDEFPSEFYSLADQIGALCMAVTLESESLPKYVDFTSFPATICLPLGESTTFPITLRATSGSPIESVDLEYTLGGKLNQFNYVLDTPIPAGAGQYLKINLEFPAQNEKLNETVEFKLTKINGVDNESENATAEATVVVVDEVPEHQTLYEEYTGTWCQYCPGGFAALEYISKNHPEFVTASYHYGYGTQAPDPMEVLDFFPSPEVTGFPSAVLNRTQVMDPYYGTYTYDLPLPVVGDVLALNAIPTAWKISVTHEWESSDVLVAKAEVANMAGYSGKNFKIAYMLLADGITGQGASWAQTNYYSSQKPQYIDELNAFCRGGEYGKSKVMGLVFNDVVISPEGVMGEPGSIPNSLEAEVVVEHSKKFDLTKIKSDLIPDKNNLRVIAAVVDASGSVLNCAKDEVDDFDVNAVEGIDDDSAPVEYYNLNGVKISKPTQGVFIRRQGAKADKVLIR